MNHNRKRKALVLSMALAATVLLPQNATAQYDENKYGIQPWFGSSLLGRENDGNRDGESYSFTNGNFGESDPNPSPLGSGLAILIGAGLGYVALKKKEDKQ